MVHRLIEKKQQWQFVLAGSSARKLKREGVDLLAGRAVVRHMHPFMAAELQDAFTVEKTLHVGLVPLVIESEDVLDTLSAYVGVYLNYEKDLSGLNAFCVDYPEAIPILLYYGQERLLKKNILCLPIEDFLKTLTPLRSVLME